VITKQDQELIRQFETSQIREIFHEHNKITADLGKLKIGDIIVIKIDLSKFPNYFETWKMFIEYNKYGLKHQEFYVQDLNYHHNHSPKIVDIISFLSLQKLIAFLREIATYETESNGEMSLFFQKPDKICSLKIDYCPSDIKNFTTNTPITKIKNHVLKESDRDTRKRLLTNEMINLLTIEGVNFPNLLKSWNNIVESYNNSFQIYLSEFSFEKIKTSSQEYFHELTDRIYSTITKFSSYILTVPVAYILILRFFDFDGKNLTKDSFLITIGILYFVVIWFVLLNNLSKAFTAIEKDISKFLNRVKNENNLTEITENLELQRTKLIPSQKRKILLVRIISLIILALTVGAYLMIYCEYILQNS
jgi:hypothetical protein